MKKVSSSHIGVATEAFVAAQFARIPADAVLWVIIREGIGTGSSCFLIACVYLYNVQPGIFKDKVGMFSKIDLGIVKYHFEVSIRARRHVPYWA